VYFLEVVVELVPRDSGLDRGVHVSRVDLEDSVHPRNVEAESALDSDHASFHGCSSAVGDQWHSMLTTGVDREHDVFSAQRPTDDIRRAGPMMRDILGVFADGFLGGREPLAKVRCQVG
tara:strand:- start:128 stop:484 length:357 start_codon:yes stop_codon:yes gene_type:complete